MKIIVNENIKKVKLILDNAITNDEIELHVPQDADLVLINIEEIVQEATL